MRGVVGGVDAARQHGIVAGVLALLAQARAGDPDERVEPVDGAQQLAGHLRGPVAAADVRELVAQHDARALAGPAARGRREDDFRAPAAPMSPAASGDRSGAGRWDAAARGRAPISAASRTHGPRSRGRAAAAIRLSRIRPTRSTDSVTSAPANQSSRQEPRRGRRDRDRGAVGWRRGRRFDAIDILRDDPRRDGRSLRFAPGLRRQPLAARSVQDGATRDSSGVATAQPIATDSTQCRAAAGGRRHSRAIAERQQHEERDLDAAVDQERHRFPPSSPSRPARRSARARLRTAARLRRRAARRRPSPWSRRRRCRPGGAAPTCAPRGAAAPAGRRSAGRRPRGGRGPWLRGRAAASGPSRSSASPDRSAITSAAVARPRR